MTQFQTEQEAKEYLAGRIVEESARQRQTLTEIERKMLFFTESGWTLPDMMDVNAEFEEHYEDGAYERKIHAMVRAIEARDKAENADEAAAWKAAVKKLREGDHYLLVMIDGLSLPNRAKPRPRTDFLRLILTALVLSGVMFLLMYLFARR